MGLDARDALDLLGDELADAAQARSAGGLHALPAMALAVVGDEALGHDHLSGDRPRSWTLRTHSETCSMDSRNSGMRIAGAGGHAGVQCDPAHVASITSATMQRWWDSPVVRIRSMASVAMDTAVSKPKV